MNAAKSEVEVTKAKSEDKELRAKQLLQQVRSKIQNLTKDLDSTRKQRDSFKARLDEAESGKRLLFIVYFSLEVNVYYYSTGVIV